jgi:crotonobetainyl-CoA:carnitine CoA-transferase CaiB-like acyl-CoA transferase
MSALPLSGIRVLDFGHTVMGPSAGLILGDLGADVIKIEPPHGDPTRSLRGFGTGYFGYFNRNKRSLAVDLKRDSGRRVVLDLVERSDVLIENFGPGTMDRLNLGYDGLAARNPRLIYASLKGFLPGPYDQRLALDEVVQMMSGLAFMTGPSGRPLRAGTSAIDIAGGMFAVIAIMAALRNRDSTGSGQRVTSALFESAVFLMGQHLCYAAQSDVPVPPMPERVSAWAIYEIFPTRDDQQIFVGITSDNHWERFCAALGRDDLRDDPEFRTNNQRISARPRLIPIIQATFAGLSLNEAIALCETCRIPFSPVARPEDLFDDPHLAATGGLLPTVLPNGIRTALPRLPLQLGDTSFDLRRNPPAVGEHTDAILAELGYGPEQISALAAEGTVAQQAEFAGPSGSPAGPVNQHGASADQNPV